MGARLGRAAATLGLWVGVAGCSAVPAPVVGDRGPTQEVRGWADAVRAAAAGLKQILDEATQGPVSVFAGCAAARQRLGMALVPLDTELALGRQIAAQVERRERVYPGVELQRYVADVMVRLATAAERDRPGVRFSVAVLDDATQANAFAIPGGRAYVYTGLLLLAGDEAELAGALAHEMGHVTARHIANQLATQYGLSLLAALALGEDPGTLARIASEAGNLGLMARFSREDELAADERGFRYLVAAGYDPAGLVRLFGQLAQGQDRPKDLELLLASHPETAQRIRRVEGLIARAGQPTGERDQDRYLRSTAVLRKR